jgi:type I restriction enzyme S subunit
MTLQTGKLDVNAGSEDGRFPFFTCSRETYKIDVAAFSGKSVIVAGNGDLNVKYFDGPFNAYQRTYVLQVADEGKLDARYLFYFMDDYVGTLRANTQGSTIQYLKKAQFTDAPINLPPLSGQRRIVNVMASVEEYIAALQQQADDARSARNAVLHELLTSGGSNWVETTLGEAVNIQKGKKPPSLGDETTIGQPYLTADVLRGSAPSQFVPQSALGMCVQLEEEETVLLWDGAGAGDVFRSTTGVLASTMARLSNTSKASLDSRFLHLAVQKKSPEIKSSCRGTTVPHVSPSALAATTLLIPPLPEQKRIVETVTAMDDVVGASEQAVRVAQELRSGLLSTLLSGEHEIPEAYDRLLGAA